MESIEMQTDPLRPRGEVRKMLERTDEMLKLEAQERQRERDEALKEKEAREKRTIELTNLLDEFFVAHDVTWMEFAEVLNLVHSRTNSVMGNLKISEIKKLYD